MNVLEQKINNILHCLDGPAVFNEDGSVEYYVDGVEYSEEEFYDLQIVRQYKCIKEFLGK